MENARSLKESALHTPELGLGVGMALDGRICIGLDQAVRLLIAFSFLASPSLSIHLLQSKIMTFHCPSQVIPDREGIR